MNKTYKVVTLCGSTRFKDAFYDVQKKLTLQGCIVISVGLFGHSGDDQVWQEGVKEMLDDMHKRKIDMAQEIFVINPGGYIGASTRSEVAYARAHGKGIRYLQRVSPAQITSLEPHQIFVFGSNLAGQHGGGAARQAYEAFGAIWGQGSGLQGQSYGIPTMQGGVETIAPYVQEFITFAISHPKNDFLVTRIGCGIAGFTDAQIAPLFQEAYALENVFLPIEWNPLVTL